MDFEQLKRNTLMSDYRKAAEIAQHVTDEDCCLNEAIAYGYRAGILEGKQFYREKRSALGEKLAKAHEEIAALRSKNDVLTDALNYHMKKIKALEARK